MRRQKITAGITLVELLIAIFVFIVAGSGIVGAYLSSNVLSQQARETMMAVEDLKDMMERIHTTPFTTLATTFPDGVANGPGNAYRAIVNGGAAVFPLENQQITVRYPNPGTDPLEIIVTVNWTSRGRQRNVSASTLRTSS